MKDIILIDAGTGNLRSVQKALESIGAKVERTDDPDQVLTANRVVLPGVGSALLICLIEVAQLDS
jgi:glutamine amidotransferase